MAKNRDIFKLNHIRPQKRMKIFKTHMLQNKSVISFQINKEMCYQHRQNCFEGPLINMRNVDNAVAITTVVYTKAFTKITHLQLI